jgi:hypothetical protein
MVVHEDYWLLDGSIIYAVDILNAITTCRSKGHADDNIIIDVILSSGKTIKTVDAEDYKTLDALMRWLEISSYKKSEEDLLVA